MATQLVSQDNEVRELSPAAEVQARIAKMGAQLKSVLPSHIDIAKFQRVAMTAITSDPDLLTADRQTLFSSLTKAAQDGLLPDKREGALVIFNQKVKIDGRDAYIKAVQWMPMVAGILKKVRQSGEVSSISAHAVYENDEFDHILGDDERIYHKPAEGSPGKIRGAYCIVTLKDGFKVRDYMPWWRIEKARAVAKTKSVWDAWPDEMAIKTVIRHIAKVLPQSTDIEASFERDDTQQFEATAAMLSAAPPPGPLTSAMLTQQAQGEGEVIGEAIADVIEQGRGEEDHGERTTLADAINELEGCELAIDIDKRVAALLPLLSDEDGQALRDRALEMRAARVEA